MERSSRSYIKTSPLAFTFPNKLTEDDECSTSSSYIKTTEPSFLKELKKIGVKNVTFVQLSTRNTTEKSKFSPAVSPSARFPYQRKARSISPPKDALTICERGTGFFFPARSPIAPDNSLNGTLPVGEANEEDHDLIALKQQYLKLVQQAPCLNFKSELFEESDELSGTEEFNEWESSIMKKMQLH